jgi:RNA polymerase sigma factor (sigma-70 family)
LNTSEKKAYEIINEMCNGVLRGKYRISDDDFISDAVLKIFLQFDKSKGNILFFKKWLNGAIYNHYCNYVVSKKKLKRTLNFEEMEENYSLENDSLENDSQNISNLYEYLDELPQKNRTILSMKICGGFSYLEISEQFSISPETARKQYSRALNMLRESFLPSTT